MKYVILKFSSLKSLIDFALFSNGDGWNLNTTLFILMGKVGEADLELAVNGFNAELMDCQNA